MVIIVLPILFVVTNELRSVRAAVARVSRLLPLTLLHLLFQTGPAIIKFSIRVFSFKPLS